VGWGRGVSESEVEVEDEVEDEPAVESGVETPEVEAAPEVEPAPGFKSELKAELATILGDHDLAEIQTEARRQLDVLREHAREPSPPPEPGRPLENFVWGLAQPVLGLRVLLRHGDLFVRGLIPAVLFILICLLVVERSEGSGIWGWIKAYYAVLVGAAAVSPVLFSRNYAKLAAASRRHLEVSRHEPYLRSYWQAFVESIVQAIVLAIGVAPWAALIGALPVFGWIWAAVIGWLWVLHWIVVEALDSARTLPPGEDMQTLEQRYARLDPPWYSGALLAKLRAPLDRLLLPLRLWGRVLARLGQRWRGEVAVIEARPWIAAGFGAGASLLLAIPVVNLLFRPAVVVAASHVLGRLEPEVPLPELDEQPTEHEGESPS
jgi:hypothetical protein